MSQIPQRQAARTVPIIAKPSRTDGIAQSAWAMPLPPAPEANLTLDALTDTLGRPLRDLRISVTDRCNFRCGYCMPRAAFGRDHAFLPQPELLSFEEITRAARLFLSLGVRKLRLTGGEPLLRKDLERLVAQLAGLRTLDGHPPELTLTTNGSLLARKARALKDAGLQRVTVSLDALDATTFQQMSDSTLSVSDVLDGIDHARAAGLGPIKVNMVVQRGVNEHEILPMASHFRGSGVELRFIEFMDVGHTNRWDMAHVLPSDQVRAIIETEFPLVMADSPRQGTTAARWSYADGQGHVGFISSVTQAFCGDCNRMRLSTDGRLYTCLFASRGHDLRSVLRQTSLADDAHVAARLAALWQQRQDRYSQLRGTASEQAAHDASARVEMSFIGG